MSKFFSVKRDELFGHLVAMQPICNKRTALAVTESILFQVSPRELILKATDLEISLQVSITTDGSLTEPRSFLINGRRIFEIVRELSGNLSFEIKEHSLELEADGGIAFKLAIAEADDFPPFPERIENLMQFDASFLLGLFNKVAFVVPQNNANKALNGVLFEADQDGISLVGTDGHSLARVTTSKYTLAEAQSWLLPRRAILELKKIMETGSDTVFVGTCSGQLVFSGASFNFFSKLLSDKFPEYQSALESSDFNAGKFEREALVQSLKRAGCLLAGQFISTSFKFGKKEVDINLENKEVGSFREKIIPAKYDHTNDIVARFYSPYLLQGLQAIEDKEMSFFIKNDSRPIIFKSIQKDYDFTYLVMPVAAQQ